MLSIVTRHRGDAAPAPRATPRTSSTIGQHPGAGACTGPHDDIERIHRRDASRGARSAGGRVRVLDRRGHRLDHRARGRLRPRGSRRSRPRGRRPARPDRPARTRGHRCRRSLLPPPGARRRLRRPRRLRDRHCDLARNLCGPLGRPPARGCLHRRIGGDAGDGRQPAGPPCPNADAADAVERGPVVCADDRQPARPADHVGAVGRRRSVMGVRGARGDVRAHRRRCRTSGFRPTTARRPPQDCARSCAPRSTASRTPRRRPTRAASSPSSPPRGSSSDRSTCSSSPSPSTNWVAAAAPPRCCRRPSPPAGSSHRP